MSAASADFVVSDAWRAAYPGAHAGVLVLRDAEPEDDAALDARARALEQALRARFAGQTRSELKALPTIQRYDAYYRRFKQGYHVLFQLASVALEGRGIPPSLPLVRAMFLAELEHLLLTAGHDLEALALPVRLDVADGQERYQVLNGQEKTLKRGDMYMADGAGVISSILFGPDQRTRITPRTRQALFAVYAPAGIAAAEVAAHLQAVADTARLAAPRATVAALEVVGAG